MKYNYPKTIGILISVGCSLSIHSGCNTDTSSFKDSNTSSQTQESNAKVEAPINKSQISDSSTNADDNTYYHPTHEQPPGNIDYVMLEYLI